MISQSARTPIDESNPALAVLRDRDASAIEKANAAASLAGEVLAQGFQDGSAGSSDLRDFTRALEELRRAQVGYQELARRSGELIARDVAKAVHGGLVRRLIGGLSTVENMLATQVEIWMGDAAVMAQDGESRGRLVRDWFADRVREIRETNAETIEQLVRGEVEDQA